MCIFKENLKIITGKLIESIWKEKLRPENIKERIKEAYNEIYRGNFEEIRELDEEQMHNSFLCSGNSTDRRISEAIVSSMNRSRNNIKESDMPVKIFENAEANSKQFISDLNEKSNDDNKKVNDDNALFQKYNNISNSQNLSKSKKEHSRIYRKGKSFALHNTGVNDANLDMVKVFEREKHYAKEASNNINHCNDNIINNKSSFTENNSFLGKNQTRSINNVPSSVFKNDRKMHVRSFDKVPERNLKQTLKMSSLKTNQTFNINLNKSLNINPVAKPSPFIKDQYNTAIKTKRRRDNRINNSKFDSIDKKRKQPIKNPAKDQILKLSFKKFHLRNRSVNLSRRNHQNIEIFSDKRAHMNTLSKMGNKDDENTILTKKKNFLKLKSFKYDHY